MAEKHTTSGSDGILRVARLTDVGNVRSHNEDAVAVFPERGLLIVSDGMGGMNAGDVAARLVVEVLPDMMEEVLGNQPSAMPDSYVAAIRETVERLNREISKLSDEQPEVAGMGATVVLSLIRHGQAFIGHVGDSRAYLYREGTLRRLTEDHSAGEVVFRRSELTRFIGLKGPVYPDVRTLDLQPNDKLLLCSDGLTNEIDDRAIEKIVKSSDGLEHTCRSLVQAAIEAGGRDNITVIVAEWLDKNEKPVILADRCPLCGEPYPPTHSTDPTPEPVRCRSCGEELAVKTVIQPSSADSASTPALPEPQPAPTVLRTPDITHTAVEKDSTGTGNHRRNLESHGISPSPGPQATRGLYAGVSLSDAELHEAEADVALHWKPGDVILDLYEITELLGEGGMGRVYKARHRGWNMDVAVKTPRPEIIAAVGGAEGFAGEAETWVNLGLHPHVVNCYYVRTLGGIPRIFVEYLEGGTLWDWVRSRRLYAGSREEVLARIIDVAIQAAWGLECAHKQGLIHLDVKPANVMMDGTGRAKVTDFGLARARSQAGPVTVSAEEGKTVIVAGGGMFTPAYASPEQIAGKPPTASTDIWSWAATVVEMFAGGLYWPSGHLIGEFFASFLANWTEDEVAPYPPDGITKLLSRCFTKEPAGRPAGMAEIVAELAAEFSRAIGTPYPRHEPTLGPATGDSLNNRGASMIDLGKRETALTLWDEALNIQPYHANVTYNRGLILWRAGSWDEIQLVKEMEEVLESAPGNWMPYYLLGMVHMERGDYQAAAKILSGIPSTESVRDRAQAVLELATEWAPKSRRLLRTLEGHSDAVTVVCFSPGGTFVLSGSEDASIRLWETETGRCIRTFVGHAGPVVSLSFALDGRSFLSGSKDGTMKLWEVFSGACISSLASYRPDPIKEARLTSDRKYALRAGEGEAGISVWDVRREERVGSLGAGAPSRSKAFDLVQSRLLRWRQEGSFPARYYAACFSIDAQDRLCLVAAGDAVLTVWDMVFRQPLRVLEGHGEAITSVFLSPDGTRGLSGSADKTIKLWHIPSGRCIRTFRGHSGTVSSVSMTSDGRHALSGGSNGTVRLWNINTGRCIRAFFSTTSPVKSVAISPDDLLAVSGSGDGAVRVWSITSDAPEFLASLMMSRVQTVEKALSTKMAYEQEVRSARRALEIGDAVTAARFVRRARSRKGYRRHPDALELWEYLYGMLPKRKFAGGWKMDTREGHSGAINSVRISHDQRFVLSGSSDGTIRLWDLTGDEESRRFIGRHESPVTSISISRDGSYAISASEDKTLKLWNVRTGEAVRVFEGHLGPVLTCDISHCGGYALSGSLDRTLKLWQVGTGKCLRTLTHDLHLPVSVGFAQDGRHALSGSWDKTIKLWKVASGQCVRTFGDDFHLPASVCLTYDGRYALSGGTDMHHRHIRLWDVETRRLIRSFEGHTDLVHSVCLSSDDRFALSGSRDGTVKLWDVATGQCLRTFVSHFGRVFSVSLGLDGNHAASAGDDMVVKLWKLDWSLGDRAQSDWDEGAGPYLEVFLNRHGPYARELPTYGFWKRILSFVQSRGVKPAWTEKDFDDLVYTLGCAGFGWLTADGIRRKLEEYAAQWE